MKRAQISDTGTGREPQTPINPVEGVWMIPGFGNSGVVETEEEKEIHRLKGELLGIKGDNEPSFIARNIFYNGHNEEMKLAGVEE